MSVYVDRLQNWGWRYGASCHLIADDVEELHSFAVNIGMRKEWFQPQSSPHYDLTKSRRLRAVLNGAIELDNKAFVNKIRELRELRKIRSVI